MLEEFTEQELHNLAMNVVGKDLEKQGFEFISVNSQLKKDPQFVCLKNKKLHFISILLAISGFFVKVDYILVPLHQSKITKWPEDLKLSALMK